jgi:general stress protein CsbA
MKLNRLEKTFIVLLLVVFGGIVIHAPLSVGLGTLFPDYSLLIKSWKEILLVISLVLACGIVTRRKLWKEFMNDWLFRLIAGFAALHLLLVTVLYQGVASTAAGLSIDLRYFLFFSLVYVAVKLFPQYRRRFVQVGVVGACVVVGFAALQLFLPRDVLSYIGYGKTTIQPYLTVDKNPEFIRENSTLRGPNPLGAYAGIVLCCLAAFWVRKKEWLFAQSSRRLGYAVLAACAFVALWVSYSRSALVAGIFGVLLVGAVSVARKLSRKAWIASAAILAALVGGLVMTKGSDFVSNVILHENPSGGSSVSSNDDHVESLVTSWNRFVHQPLGDGVGSTGSASLFSGTHDVIENQYLFVAHEAGWLGLLLFLVISGMVLMRLWKRRQDWLALGVFASGAALALIGLLLPVWVDDTVSIIWWGMAAIALGGTYGPRRTTK